MLLSLIVLAVIGVTLIISKPSESDFARWYVEQNKSGLGSFFNDAFEKLVESRTETSDYLILSVFELDEERYVGFLGKFFGKNSIEEAKQTLEHLIEKAGNAVSNNSQ